MPTNPINVHKIFADYFPGIEPWAYTASEALEQGSICVELNSYMEEISLQNGYIKRRAEIKNSE